MVSEHHPHAEMLIRFAEDGLNQTVREHVEECESCCSIVNEIRLIDAEFKKASLGLLKQRDSKR